MIIAPERKSMVEPNPMAHLLQRLEIYRRAREESHPVNTGMRGYDLPAVVKLLEIHRGVPPPPSGGNSGKTMVHQVRASARSGLSSLTWMRLGWMNPIVARSG